MCVESIGVSGKTAFQDGEELCVHLCQLSRGPVHFALIGLVISDEEPHVPVGGDQQFLKRGSGIGL